MYLLTNEPSALLHKEKFILLYSREKYILFYSRVLVIYELL
jgi:hypothetical protein